MPGFKNIRPLGASLVRRYGRPGTVYETFNDRPKINMCFISIIKILFFCLHLNKNLYE